MATEPTPKPPGRASPAPSPAETEKFTPIAGAEEFQVSRDRGLLRIDTVALRTPDRNFAAQAYRVERVTPTSTTFQLHFGQFLVPRRLVSLIVISIEHEPLRHFVETCRGDFIRSLQRQAGQDTGGTRLEDHEIATIDAARTWLAKATFARAAVSYNGAQLEWYDVPPQTIVSINRGWKVSPASDVISVFLSAANLLALLREIAQALKLDLEANADSGSARGESA